MFGVACFSSPLSRKETEFLKANLKPPASGKLRICDKEEEGRGPPNIHPSLSLAYCTEDRRSLRGLL